MPTDLQDTLRFAIEVSRAAGEVTLGHFGEVEVERKADATPVTRADREAEVLCRRRIEARFPADGLLGEEYGETRPGASRRWLIDPIDGTRSFVHGVPLYGVLLALEIDGDAVLGVIHFPALRETVAAADGMGCWWNDRRARVSEVATLERALALSSDVEAFRDAWELAERCEMGRTWGDCYGHALVATGRAEAMLDPVLAPWDAAALLPVIREAGGVFTDWSGLTTHLGGSGLATNARLAGEIRELLGVPSA